MAVCGIIHDITIGHEADVHGCILPLGHDGPHEFTSQGGQQYRWYTDMDCTCEHCMTEYGDFCTIYWGVSGTITSHDT